jgi:tetratricopeptide (TPR) repeat protein
MVGHGTETGGGWMTDPQSPAPAAPLDARAAQGLQVGDQNVQYNLWLATRAAARRAFSPLPYATTDIRGRDGLIGELRDGLRRRATDPARIRPVLAVLHGMPGVGKSAVAAEYARRHSTTYGLVWWIPAHDIAAVASAFARLAAQLDILGPNDQADPVVTAHAMLAAREDRWLLLFDDAPGAAVLDGVLPTSANGDVIVTSRNPNILGADVALRVFELDLADAADLIVRRTGSADLDNVVRLADEFGGLPLALEQAAAFVAAGGVDVAGYVRLIRQRRREMLAEGAAGQYTTNPVTVAAAFRLVLDQLDAPAIALLRLLVCLAPHGIPVDLLDGLSSPGAGRVRSDHAATLGSAGPLADPVARGRAFATLAGYSLVQPWRELQGVVPLAGTAQLSGRTVSIHRLLRAFILDSLAADEVTEWTRLARAVVDAATPEHPEDPTTWLRYELLIPHIRATADAAARADGSAYWRAGIFLERYGDSRMARVLWRDVVDATTEWYGPDHPRTLAATGNLAVSLAGTGDLVGAAELERRVLDGRVRTLGRQHRDTLTALGNLAIRLAVLGKLEEAAALEREVLDGRLRLLGKDHPDTLTAMSNLAIRSAALGDLAAAVDLERDVLAGRRGGGDETLVLAAMANLAATLAATGDLAAAAKMEADVYNGRRRILGENHPHTLQAMTNIAARLTSLGAAAEALTIAEPAVAGLLRSKGPDHPDTLAAMIVQAAALAASGKPREAAELQRQIIDARRRTLGDTHVESYRAMGNLAISVASLGGVAEALSLERDVLAGFTRLLGRDHAETLAAMSNLAASLATSGDLDGAIDLGRRVVAGQERLLGADHPLPVRARQELQGWSRDRERGPGSHVRGRRWRPNR